MERRVRFIVVGAFTLAAIFGVFLFVYWMHAAGGITHTRPLRVDFEGSAAGLRPGSAVLYNGVRIGEVTRIAFDRIRADFVEADLAIDATAPLRKDARVGIEAQGLLGTTVVAIYGVTADAPLLSGPEPSLTAGPSTSLAEQARAALTDIQSLVADNKAPLNDILKNVDVFSEALKRNSGKIDGILAGIDQFLGHGPKPPPPQFLALRAPTEFPDLALTTQIAVADVGAPVAFQTQKIVSRAGPDSPLVLGEAQWTDVAPKLIQLKLIEAFENAKLGASVSRPLDGGAPDFQLMLDLRRFEIDTNSHQATIDLSVRLVGKEGRVAAARIFSATAPSEAADGEKAAQALSHAFDAAAKEIVEWTVAAAAK
jgi:phospholipid/cholesterol/gamma-HCH transport system substrate-binding protein